MACRFFLAGTPAADTVSSMAIVDGVSVWPVVITAVPRVVRPLIPPAQKEISAGEDGFAIKNYDVGMYYFRRKAYDSGIIYFKDVLNKYANAPTARDAALKLVESYKAIGYRAAAVDMCSQLRQRYPRDPDVSEVCQGVPIVAATRDDAATPPETQQGVSIPNSPAGRALKAWLDAQNSGQRAQMEAYNEKYTPVAARPGMIRAQQDWGAFDMLSVTKSEPRSIEFVLREKTTGDTDVGIMVMSDSEPALVKWLKILVVPTGKTPADAALLEKLRDFPP